MKAVILAAGRGSRMGLLTDKIPKPLLKVCGKSLITRTLESLPLCITECIVVTGYRGEMIKDHLGSSYGRLVITYVEQKFPGTGGALQSAQPYIVNEKLFFVSSADNIFYQDELEVLICNKPVYGATLNTSIAKETPGISFDEECRIVGRKPVVPGEQRYYGVGAYVLPPDIFTRPFTCLPSGEYSIPHSLTTCSFIVYARFINLWLSINIPHDIKIADRVLRTQNWYL